MRFSAMEMSIIGPSENFVAMVFSSASRSIFAVMVFGFSLPWRIIDSKIPITGFVSFVGCWVCVVCVKSVFATFTPSSGVSTFMSATFSRRFLRCALFAICIFSPALALISSTFTPVFVITMSTPKNPIFVMCWILDTVLRISSQNGIWKSIVLWPFGSFRTKFE